MTQYTITVVRHRISPPGEKDEYHAWCDQCDGAISCGDTAVEAIRNARDAAMAWFAVKLHDASLHAKDHSTSLRVEYEIDDIEASQKYEVKAWSANDRRSRNDR